MSSVHVWSENRPIKTAKEVCDIKAILVKNKSKPKTTNIPGENDF